jgi:hypothetical protein
VAIDRVQPLKLEDPGTGGVETDCYPTALDSSEDFVECRGIALENDTSDDSSVLLSRDVSNNMTFVDPVVGSVYTLSELIGGGSSFDANNIVLEVSGCVVYANDETVVTRV